MNDQHISLPISYEAAQRALTTVEAVTNTKDTSLYPLAVQEATDLQDLPDEYKAIAMTKLTGALCLNGPVVDAHYIGMLAYHLTATKELQHQLHTDAVTGFANRRGLLEWASNYYDPQHNTYGILAIDLTSFKKVNDKLGHVIGDDALKVACEIIASQTRLSRQKDEDDIDERQHDTTDVLSVARIGGDEIICIMDFNGIGTTLAHIAIARVTNHLESRNVMMQNSDRTIKQSFGFRVGALLVGPSNPLSFSDALGAVDDLCNARRTTSDR